MSSVYSLSLWTAQIGKKHPQHAEILKNQKVTNVPEASIGRCKLKGQWECVVWRYKKMLAIFKTLTCPFSGTRKLKLKSTILELKKYGDALFQKKQKSHVFEGLVRFFKLLVSLDCFVIFRPLVLSTTKISTCPYVLWPSHSLMWYWKWTTNNFL